MAFPTTVRRATLASSTSNANSFALTGLTWNTNTAISAGDRVLWVVIVSVDGSPTLSESSGLWTPHAQTSEGGGAVTQRIFTQETLGAYASSAMPSLTVSSTANEQYSCVVLAFKSANGGKGLYFLEATAAQGSSTNSNPPSLSNGSGASRDITVVATRSGDSTTVATVAPGSYGNLQTATAGGTNGASTNTAERQITVASGGSEDPGTFTSGNEQWVSNTVGVYEGVLLMTVAASTTPTMSRVHAITKALTRTCTPTFNLVRSLTRVIDRLADLVASVDADFTSVNDVTFDPAKQTTFVGHNGTFADGNLTYHGVDEGSQVQYNTLSTIALNRPVGYVELTVDTGSIPAWPAFGVADSSYDYATQGQLGARANSWGFRTSDTNLIIVYAGSGTIVDTISPDVDDGQVVGMIVHKATGKAWIIHPDDSISPDTPTFGADGSLTSGTGYATGLSEFFFGISTQRDDGGTVNAGQAAKVRTTPTNVELGWASSGAETPMTVDASTTPSYTLVRSAGKLISRTADGAATIARAVAKIVTRTADATAARVASLSRVIDAATTDTATVVRSAAKPITATSDGTGSLATLKAYGATIERAIDGVASRVIDAGKLVASSVTPSSAMAKVGSLFRTISADVAASSVAVKSLNRVIAATADSAASLVRLTGKILAAAVATVQELGAVKAFTATIDRATTPAAALARSVAKPIGATASGVATLARNVAKTIAAAIAAVASIVADFNGGTTQFDQEANASSTPSPSLAKVFIASRAFTALATGVGSISSMISKLIELASAPLGSLSRLTSRTISLELVIIPAVAAARFTAVTVQAIANAAGAALRSLLSGSSITERILRLPPENRMITLASEASRILGVPREEERTVQIGVEARLIRIPAEGSRTLPIPAEPTRVITLPPENRILVVPSRTQ